MLTCRVIFMMVFQTMAIFPSRKMWYFPRYYIHPGMILTCWRAKSWRWMVQLICLFKQVFLFRFQALIFQCPCWPSSFLLPQSLATCCQVDVNGQVSVEAIDSGSGKSVLVLKKVDLGTQGIFWRETNSSPEQVYSWKDVHFPSHHFWYLYLYHIKFRGCRML